LGGAFEYVLDDGYMFDIAEIIEGELVVISLINLFN
jgi:hypothetical protein